MNPWRTFILWLARKEIAGVARECESAAVKLAEAGVTITEQMQALAAARIEAQAAYAIGFQHGNHQMLAQIQANVEERLGIDVMPADIERARKGLLH